MTGLNAILVSVDYHGELSLTLPYNRHHFDRVMIVTSPADIKTQLICQAHSAEMYITDAFYRNGAMFNKWLALEEGLDVFGRDGFLCIMDADILWPKKVELELKEGYLQTPCRRMWEDWPSKKRHIATTMYASDIPPEHLWHIFHLHPQQHEWAGYSQIFHASDPVLTCSNCGCKIDQHKHIRTDQGIQFPNLYTECTKPVWHLTNYISAGTADSFFQAKWTPDKKIRPNFDVLHLGRAGENWMGRVSNYIDGTAPPEAEKRRSRLNEMFANRRGKSGMDRFKHEIINPPNHKD